MSCVASAATSCACCKTWEGMDGWVLSTSISQIQVSNLCELRTKQHRNYLYPCLFCNAHLLKGSTTPQIRGTILHSIWSLPPRLSLLKIEEQTHSDRTSIISFIYSCCFPHPKSLYVKVERDKNRTRNQTQEKRKKHQIGWVFFFFFFFCIHVLYLPWVFCESWFGKLVKRSHHLHFNWNGDPLLLHKWKKRPKRTAPKQKKEPAADVPHLQH